MDSYTALLSRDTQPDSPSSRSRSSSSSEDSEEEAAPIKPFKNGLKVLQKIKSEEVTQTLKKVCIES